MTEPNIYDLVVDELVERQRLVKAELRSRFKKTKPFRMEPMSDEEALYHYNQLTPEKILELISTHGEDAINEMVFQLETLKAKKERGNA